MNDCKENALLKLIAFKHIIFIKGEKKWPRIVFFCLYILIVIILVYIVSLIVNPKEIDAGIRALPDSILSPTFVLMLFIGFLAQLSDGSLGVGYGIIAITYLLASGVNPAFVSSQVHTARVF